MFLFALVVIALCAPRIDADKCVLANGATVAVNGTSVSIRSPGGAMVWESADGRGPFISAKNKHYNVFQYGGNFKLHESVVATTTNITVSSVVPGPNSSCVVTGDLGGLVTYSFALRSDGEASAVRFDIAIETAEPETYNWVEMCHRAAPNEAIFGFGEQYNGLDMRGRVVPIFVREQGVGRGLEPLTSVLDMAGHGDGGSWATTYCAMPLYHTSHNRSLLLHHSEYSAFDLSTVAVVCVGVNASRMSGRVVLSASLPEAVSYMTSVNGRPRPLPAWFTAGAIVGMQGGQAVVNNVYDALAALGCPIAAMWLQDWCGSRPLEGRQGLWWNWESDDVLYPQWKDFTRNFSDRGVRMMGYINPMLVNASTKPLVRTNYYATAVAEGYFVDGWSGYNGASLLNLTDTAARAFYKRIIQEEMVGTGLSGWMADFGEALPPGPPHNAYPDLWFGLVHEALTDIARLDDVVFFGRAGWVRSPSLYSLGWQGDQLTSWDAFDGLGSAVTSLLSGGLSGMAFLHSDIGGYTNIDIPGFMVYNRSRELLYRWCDHSALTVAYRTHDGGLPAINAQFYTDAAAMAHYVRMAKVYAAWGWHRAVLVAEAVATGLPVVRPLVLHYTTDAATHNLTTQYLLGEDLLVVPVTAPGVSDVNAYFPAGGWVHLWTSELITGPATARVTAPIGFPPVFYRDGGSTGPQLIENLKMAGLYTWPGGPGG